MDTVKNTTGKIKGGWEKIEPGKRKAIILVTLASVVLAVILSVYTSRVNYEVLFTDLELKDAAVITQDLDARGGIKYKIENGGRTIYLDEKHVAKYRLEVAMNGLMPQSSTGFEIFDEMGMMVTDEDRKIMYQRALEGELQRSIMSLDEIETARVHLVMSEDSIFNADRRDASASVILGIRPGAKVEPAAVKGIIALITGAVENLPSENVRVIDTGGNLLSLGVADGAELTGIGILDKQREITKVFENELISRLLSLLGPAMGPDKIKVSVYAELDFDAEEKTVISYENPVVRSEQISATGGELDRAGIIEGPVDDNVQNVLEGGEGSMSSLDSTINYEVTESRTNTIKAPGKVTKITTSVLFDGNLTAGQRESIRNLVATTTGYDLERGDDISIEGVVFDKTYQEELEKALEEQRLMGKENLTFMEKFADYMFMGVFILLGIIIIAAVMKILFGKRKREEVYDVTVPINQIETGEDMGVIEEVYKKFTVRENQKEKQIKEYATENPDSAADLIKAWVKE